MKIFFFGIKVILYHLKKYKYSVYQFFGYENGFWYYLRVRARKS